MSGFCKIEMSDYPFKAMALEADDYGGVLMSERGGIHPIDAFYGKKHTAEQIVNLLAAG